MDATIKAQWLEDLRSGNFKQGKGTLHQVVRVPQEDGTSKLEHRFCCLGVLCEQAVAEGVADREFVEGGGSNGEGVYRYFNKGGEGYLSGESAYLPRAVREWSGVDASSPRISDPDYDGCVVALADLNDTEGDDFATLATKIENAPKIGSVTEDD